MLEQAQASKLKLAKKEKSPKRNLRSGTGVVSRGKPGMLTKSVFLNHIYYPLELQIKQCSYVTDNYGYENKDNKEKARGRKTRAAAAKAKWVCLY